MSATAAVSRIRSAPPPLRVEPFAQAEARNGLLARLVATDALLRVAGEVVALRQGDVLQTRGQPIDHVYFPTTAVVSFLGESERGRAIEVASVGPEGFTGVPIMLGGRLAPTSATVQLSGEALRVSVAMFRRLIDANHALRHACLAAANAFLDQALQLSACNAQHQLAQRCARWLLLANDRMGVASLPITQAFLATLLGARRSGVTITLIGFRRAGAVQYARASVSVLDREQLESAACRCVRTIREASAFSPSSSHQLV